jgi:hypothetical protein
LVQGFQGGGEFSQGEGLIAVGIEFLQEVSGDDLGAGWALGAIVAIGGLSAATGGWAKALGKELEEGAEPEDGDAHKDEGKGGPGRRVVQFSHHVRMKPHEGDKGGFESMTVLSFFGRRSIDEGEADEEGGVIWR